MKCVLLFTIALFMECLFRADGVTASTISPTLLDSAGHRNRNTPILLIGDDDDEEEEDDNHNFDSKDGLTEKKDSELHKKEENWSRSTRIPIVDDDDDGNPNFNSKDGLAKKKDSVLPKKEINKSRTTTIPIIDDDDDDDDEDDDDNPNSKSVLAKKKDSKLHKTTEEKFHDAKLYLKVIGGVISFITVGGLSICYRTMCKDKPGDDDDDDDVPVVPLEAQPVPEQNLYAAQPSYTPYQPHSNPYVQQPNPGPKTPFCYPKVKTIHPPPENTNFRRV